MLRRKKSQRTVLVINSDFNVLALMKGVLENDCRVLLAADAESAVRLLQIQDVDVDLAVIDRNILDRRKGGMIRRMTDIRPQLRILLMAGCVQDGVIRLQTLTPSNTISLLESIQLALSANGSSKNSRLTRSRNTPGPCQAYPARVIPFVPKAIVAGQTTR